MILIDNNGGIYIQISKSTGNPIVTESWPLVNFRCRVHRGVVTGAYATFEGFDRTEINYYTYYYTQALLIVLSALLKFYFSQEADLTE